MMERMEEQVAEKRFAKMTAYMEAVLSWNEKINLTNITSPEEFAEKHFLDSLSVIDTAEMEDAGSIVDLGTGGGFPGVPLAICYPDKSFLLVDSLDKKLKVIQSITEELGIKNISLLHMRAEDMGQSKAYREKFDLCLSRAVANLSTLAEYCLPLVKVGGVFIAYKGSSAEEEAEAADEAIVELGGALYNIEETILDHNLVYIEKEQKTPKKYPRKAGTPSKSPL